MPPDIPNLSARLWHALLQADKAAAAPLIDDAAVFVHMGATSILLNKIRLTAVVKGETVTHPFGEPSCL